MRHKLLALTAAALLIGNAYADDVRPALHGTSSFDGHIVFCAPRTPPTSFEVLPDGTEITTFVNIGNIWLTGNPLVDGVEENHVTAISPPDSDTDRIEISGTIDVDAVDGGWRFRQLLFASPTNFSGWGVGVGTGDLRGRLMLFTADTPEMISNSPCGVPFAAPISGTVFTIRWRT